MGSQDYRLATPAPDRVELDPERYWTAACQVVRQAVEGAGIAPEEVLALGVSSQGETTICVDEKGIPLYPALVWLDHRAQAEARRLNLELGEQAYRRTGIPTIDATWTACKIAWIREHEPDVFQRTHRFLLAQNFIVQRLTGEFVTDGGVACSTLLLDINTHGWWAEALDAVGLTPELLPKLQHVGDIAGPLTSEAADAVGLRPGLPVVLAGMDQIAGAIGAGNLSSEIISESTGGALTMHVTVDRPDLDPAGRIPVYLHALPGKYLFDPVCETGGMALKWFRDAFCQEEVARARQGQQDPYDLITGLAADIAPGCQGLTMLPHLTGAFSPEYEPDRAWRLRRVHIGPRKRPLRSSDSGSGGLHAAPQYRACTRLRNSCRRNPGHRRGRSQSIVASDQSRHLSAAGRLFAGRRYGSLRRCHPGGRGGRSVRRFARGGANDGFHRRAHSSQS